MIEMVGCPQNCGSVVSFLFPCISLSHTNIIDFGIILNQCYSHRHALEEKAVRVAQCTEELCNSLVEETLHMEIAYLVREVLNAQLRQINKFIRRCLTL